MEEWMVYIYIPRLKLDFTTILSATDNSNWYTEHSYVDVQRAHLLVTAIDELDLWWPYPAEQTEWLSQSLTKIPPKTQETIADFLSSFMDFSGNTELLDPGYRFTVTPTNVTFGSQSLDKRDCLVIGLYISSLGLQDITPPPFPLLISLMSCLSKTRHGQGHILGSRELQTMKQTTRLTARKALQYRQPYR